MKKVSLYIFLLMFVIFAIYAVKVVFAMFLVDIEQPIEFNHKKHVADVGLECIDCHKYYETQHNSGPPTIDICLECHSDPVTESPEEEKIRKFAEKEMDIPWKRIYYMPDHVFFSHRLHTGVAKISCEKCHGKMEEQVKPPSRPLVLQTMEFCLDCHRETHAAVDCLACHK